MKGAAILAGGEVFQSLEGLLHDTVISQEHASSAQGRVTLASWK